MKLIIIALVMVSGIAAHASEILACKPVELVEKETKSGYATRLTNIKGSETVYMIDGKRVQKADAIKASVKTIKKVASSK